MLGKRHQDQAAWSSAARKDRLSEVFRLGKAARRFLRWVLRTERTQRFVEAAAAGGPDEAQSQHMMGTEGSRTS